MELMEFVEQALKTDRTDRNKKYECLQIGLHGIAGEAGSVVSEAKKCLRDGRLPSLPSGVKENICEELGDLLWYIAFVSDQLEINLDDVAAANLKKTHALWSEELPELPDYDNHNYDEHKFLRRMTFRFEEDTACNIPRVKMRPEGELAERFQRERNQHSSELQIGDGLDDNTIQDDGYRYHDVIHLAHATVLGWSPVLRALIGAQRRHVGDCDRVQDGARAKAIEEGLVAFVFNYLAPYEFSTEHLDWTLFKHIRRTVRGLEVANQPIVAWRSAYKQAFQVFLKLCDNRGGVIECDLDQRRLMFSE